MSAYAELLKELQGEHDALTKSIPAGDGDGDDKIAAAAAEGGDVKSGGEPDGDEGKGGAGDGDGDEAKSPMAKSFKVTTADGEEVDAMDATDLIKSLSDKVEALGGKLTETETGLAKALTDTLTLVKGQADLIKSLSVRLDTLGKTGAGRKTVLTVHEPLAKSLTKADEPDGIEPGELLTKALDAQKAGRLMAWQVSTIETCINTRREVPPHLVKAVLGK